MKIKIKHKGILAGPSITVLLIPKEKITFYNNGSLHIIKK